MELLYIYYIYVHKQWFRRFSMTVNRTFEPGVALKSYYLIKREMPAIKGISKP